MNVLNLKVYFAVIFQLILCATFLSASLSAQESSVKLGSCTGGVVNKKVISEEKSVYPEQARKALAEGTVIVMVFIDENGKVYQARACSGHKLLRPAAVKAAYKTLFQPTVLVGKKVKVSGVLVFKFSLDQETGRLANFDNNTTK